jgi:hypothetical protein
MGLLSSELHWSKQDEREGWDLYGRGQGEIDEYISS